MPRQHRRTVHRRRDRFQGRTQPESKPHRVSVRFSKDLNRFVTGVAHALRRHVKFRSDDGVVARGLVLDSDPEGSLYSIHWHGTHNWGWREGQSVSLWALLYRRVSDTPSERWVTKIRFERFWTSKSFKAEIVTPELTVEERVDQILQSGKKAGGEVSGDAGKRIRAYLVLAEKVGYPGLLELWYFNPSAVKVFAWASGEEQRRMLQRGGGFPPRGTLTGNWQGGPPSWRIQPFRDMLQKYSEGKVERWWLEEVDRDVGRSIQALVNAPGGKGMGGESAVSEPTRQFRKGLKNLARTPGNLYYESDRNTTDRRSFWEIYG